MSSKIIFGIVIIAVILGGVYYFMQKQYQPTSSPTVTQQTTQQSQAPVGTNTVTIQNFAFNPGTLTVKQGETVTWMNQDAATHKIKSDTFNSPDLNQGDKFEFIFNNKGSFDYNCSIHPSMTGKIIVE